MQFSKAVLLILAAVSAVSAEFTPPWARTSSAVTRAGGAVKKLFRKVQMAAGRRLQPGSDECETACAGSKALMATYMEKTEEMQKGDYTWMCPSLDIITCMEGAKACEDKKEDDHDHKEEEEEEEGDGLHCVCACPDIAKMHEMEEKDYCSASSPLTCVMSAGDKCTETKKEFLKDGSEADLQKGIDLMCKRLDLECDKKGEAMQTDADCIAEGTKWESAECDAAGYKGESAFAAKAGECCPAGEKMWQCYSTECMKVDMQMMVHSAADADEKEKEELKRELDKNYAIGKGCPGAGMPTSEADLADAPAAAAADSAWMSLPHVIPFVAMVGSLLA